MIIAVYLFLCLVVACLGIGTRLGYFWNFILAFLLTPPVVLIAHMIRRALANGSVSRARAIIADYERRRGLRS